MKKTRSRNANEIHKEAKSKSIVYLMIASTININYTYDSNKNKHFDCIEHYKYITTKKI